MRIRAEGRWHIFVVDDARWYGSIPLHRESDRTQSKIVRSYSFRYTAVPTRVPIPAVAAIAAAPQNATRKVALTTGAPPVLAPMAPSIAKHSNEATETVMIIGRPTGESHALTRGRQAPVVNVAAEVSAA